MTVIIKSVHAKYEEVKVALLRTDGTAFYMSVSADGLKFYNAISATGLEGNLEGNPIVKTPDDIFKWIEGDRISPESHMSFGERKFRKPII